MGFSFLFFHNYIQSGYFGNNCDLSVEDNYGENKLFYDGYSNRFFESTIEQVMSAEYHLNRNYVLRGYTVLNELYEFLGLDDTEEGSVLGWAPIDDGMYWIDFNHHKARLKDGTEYYILQMPFAPRANYHEDEQYSFRKFYSSYNEKESDIYEIYYKRGMYG